MPLKVLDTGNILRTITSLKIWDGGALRPLRTLKVLGTDGVSLVTVAGFAPPLSLEQPYGAVYVSGASAQLASGPIQATPSGGVAPYTYSWGIVSGACTFTAPTSSVTSVNSPTLGAGDIANATVRCTCTDDAGQTATWDIDITFEFASPYAP